MKTKQLVVSTTVTLAMLAGAAGVAAAADAAIQRCREVTDSARRLACYDALTLPATGVNAKPLPSDRFGMEQQLLKSEPDALESQIRGRFSGWQPLEKIELANGQIWQISDGSNAVLDLLNPKVAVRRGTFGAFYLEVEGTNRSPRVKRVR